MKHFISISHLTTPEFKKLLQKAAFLKQQFKSNVLPEQKLAGKTVGLLFTKRSTRTRISSEAAVHYFGGHPLFLGSSDIQLGVNESFYDTTKVVSSMASGIFARVNTHSQIQELVKHSSAPIINSLCDTYHPLQAVCDILTIQESFGADLKGKKLTWVGDANNVINDLSVAALRSGMDVSVAIPNTYTFNEKVAEVAHQVAAESGAKFEVSHDPVGALEGSNVVVTDTFVSMGEESQKAEKLKAFNGFQVNKGLIGGSQISKDWIFMHCLPRHTQEVSDEVFYSENSVVFREAENRLYAAMAVVDEYL